MARTAMVFGGSGLVGGHLIELLLSKESPFASVLSVGRRPLDLPGVPHSRLLQVSWEALDGDPSNAEGQPQIPEDRSFSVDSVFIALGSTIKKAGSRDAFRRIDLDLVVQAAGAARRLGASHCYLVSALGADARSRIFYNCVKGEAEEAVARLGFDRLCIFRPSLLLGQRREKRSAEALGQGVGRIVGPLMVGPLARYRPIQAMDVARAMLNASMEQTTDGRAEAVQAIGVEAFESEQIFGLARKS